MPCAQVNKNSAISRVKYNSMKIYKFARMIFKILWNYVFISAFFWLCFCRRNLKTLWRVRNGLRGNNAKKKKKKKKTI